MRAIGTTKDEVNDRTGCMEENCICRSDPTTKCERLEEEEQLVIRAVCSSDSALFRGLLQPDAAFAIEF